MGDNKGAQNAAAIETLAQELPNAVLKPGSKQYEEENGRCWNQDNADIKPQAIVTPSSVQDTASILRILSNTNTPFAIRSGGYMPVPGHNTSPSVLISTSHLSSIELLSNGDLVRFGAGLQWGTVYDFLEPHGLVVPGGRNRYVGVSGFLLHGGVSHFYADVGWACEAVAEFKIALSTGEVMTASEKQNPDLYWALKGGGKNFGVVTAFTMRTRKLPKMWGGVRVALGTDDVAGKVFGALHKELKGDVDEKAHVEVISFFNPHACQSGDPMLVLGLAYAAEVERPEALSEFLDVQAVADMTRVTTQRDLADDEKSFVGYDKRGLFRSLSYRGSPELTLSLYNEFYAFVKESHISDEDPAALAAMLWLPAGRNLASGTSVNSIGEDEEPYFSINICFRWESASVSSKMHAFADTITEQLKQRLRNTGAFIPFTYGNIAGVQDVTFAGLPEKTKTRLREVSEKYDPQGVFQKLASGFGLE